MSASTPKVLFGFHAVGVRLKTAPQSIIEIYYEPTRRDQRMRQFLERAREAGVRLIEADGLRIAKLAGSQGHQGVAARVQPLAQMQSLDDLLDQLEADGVRNPLLLVLDGVTDPHNLGACLRSADAAGVHAVIVPRDKATGLTPIVRKVACGAAEVIPLAAWSGPQSPPAEDARTEAFLPDPLWQATPPVGEATEPVSPPPATEPLPPAEMAPLTEVPAEPSEPVAEAPKPWVAAPRPVQVELDFGFAAPPAPDPAESVLVIEPEAVEQAPAAESSPPATAPEPPEPPLVWLPAGLRALPASALTDRAEALRPLAMRLVALRSRLQEAHRQSRS